MDLFTRAYITCALWSSTDDDGDPLDARFSAEDIAPDTLNAMQADCERFYAEHEADVEDRPTDAGHDFWLTRCGHGCGYWDGDWPDDVGTRLTEACKKFGNYDLYVGDDGLVHGAKG